MKQLLIIILFISLLMLVGMDDAAAQCSICTKTAAQLGEKPARGLNAGILYLAFTPFAVVGIIGYRWWRNNKSLQQ